MYNPPRRLGYNKKNKRNNPIYRKWLELKRDKRRDWMQERLKKVEKEFKDWQYKGNLKVVIRLLEEFFKFLLGIYEPSTFLVYYYKFRREFIEKYNLDINKFSEIAMYRRHASHKVWCNRRKKRRY
ncbi:MAG: hypothetical protein ACTSQS_19170 [Promethearchaeota archaeon]